MTVGTKWHPRIDAVFLSFVTLGTPWLPEIDASIICDIGDKVTSQLLTLCFSYLWHGDKVTPRNCVVFSYVWNWGQSDIPAIDSVFYLFVTWRQSDISKLMLFLVICDMGTKWHLRHWCCDSIICDIGDKVTSQLLTLCFSYLWHGDKVTTRTWCCF